MKLIKNVVVPALMPEMAAGQKRKVVVNEKIRSEIHRVVWRRMVLPVMEELGVQF